MTGGNITWLCRDCLTSNDLPSPPEQCPSCRGTRIVAHSELSGLAIAHIDCDAFYATIEKRDNPDLKSKPVIVGGSRRGVVAAACYVARIYGVRSAMPMFKALAACPDAVVIRPNMAKYRKVGRAVREIMQRYTPLVEPLSIDEAFLDLSGTEALHRRTPAASLAHLVLALEHELKITASIGLSHNKFLAKIASDLDKPRGYAVVGRAETSSFLAEKPVSIIWGVGRALQKKLTNDGIIRIGDLRAYSESDLIRRYGAMGRRLYHFSHGRDIRQVSPESETKSISTETTFNDDLSDFKELRRELWSLSESVARRLKRADLDGGSVSLKLKTKDFKIIPRSRKLTTPTQLADELFRNVSRLLEREADGRRFRLLGVGAHDLRPAEEADCPSLLDPDRTRRAELESAMDRLREKLGPEAVSKGRTFHAKA
ncbi:MAG: DNA polymerase IV, partial [Kiloniellales bacterium]|nr:DNA polymerase IV [Kiloniellales bacterium]